MYTWISPPGECLTSSLRGSPSLVHPRSTSDAERRGRELFSGPISTWSVPRRDRQSGHRVGAQVVPCCRADQNQTSSPFFMIRFFFVHKNQSIMNYLISQMRKMWRFPALGGTPQSSLRTDPAGVTVITSNSKPRAKHTTAAARGKNLGRENQKGRTFEPFDLSGNIREHTCNHVNDKNMSIYL